MGFILSAIKIIFLLGFLIFIHEGGHCIVAKICKVKVNEFAIGFGPTIWKKQGKETKYALRLIPLGGFVSMEGETEDSDKEGSFSRASIPRRIAIVVAGATVNIIFAIIVYFILMASTGTYISNQIDQTLDGYAAQVNGLQAGDRIIKIDGKDTKRAVQITKILEKNKGENLNITFERNNTESEMTIKPTKKDIKSTGIYLKDSNKIIAVDKDSSAEKQGIETNDKILEINGEDTQNNPNKIIELISEAESKINLKIQRGKDILNIELMPDITTKYYLGITFKHAEDTFENRIYYGITETGDFLASILDNLKQLFTGKVGIDQMTGPVGISEAVAETEGIQDFVYLLALISLSLGITNLLPIPALDGGKLLILIIESIRRKPLKEGTELKIQMLGFSILIALSIYVTINDILRLF